MSELPATELLPPSGHGRRFTTSRRVRLGDVDTDGQLRLDAIARYLQDVASDDALDAGLPNAMGWVVRRTLMRVESLPVLNAAIELTTFCTGAGRSWAERRTSIDLGGAAVEAVSLWVQVDAATGRPTRLGPEFFDRYGEAAAGRSVSSRLTLPGPPAGAPATPWSFRRTDLDPFGHVNNAAQWTVLEEALGTRDRLGTFEVEYLAAVDLDGALSLVVRPPATWLVADGKVRTAFRRS